METPAADPIAALCAAAGACRSGVARAAAVDPADMALLAGWLAGGRNGCMDYMERYRELRADPRGLLEGARSIVVCAFACRQQHHNPYIADYALGSDYHSVLRMRLEPVAEAISERFGGQTRICVDSAPLRERYWAVKAGVGTTGLNGMLFVPGIGCSVLLAEILCTAELPATQPLDEKMCNGCGACVRACPVHALDGQSGVDGRRCLSCLTLEWRGELPEGTRLHGRLAGCDTCTRVCPANKGDAQVLPELQPRPEILALTPEEAATMGRGAFGRIFNGTALMRLRLAGLRRNARLILDYTR
ncbi:MAG: DUF1730 domain-containing protein [Muribaculaceae bacterium]|nr:DUF1730 domain-containing protein [Muribaculaceae bacterium]